MAWIVLVLILLGLLSAPEGTPLAAPAPKAGGILTAMAGEDSPTGFSIHQELDRTKRLGLVAEIQRKLEADAAKPMLGWRTGYVAQWPYVRNLVPHHGIYNWARMQEVWLDRNNAAPSQARRSEER